MEKKENEKVNGIHRNMSVVEPAGRAIEATVRAVTATARTTATERTAAVAKTTGGAVGAA